ncbi:hypothetical protein [Candidatus Berkiella aquae]|uniref:Uncharacterized protein n=1 Tax=Candidatus Berkiella aquae TaxID=295108 RepID=A0A0Q9YWL6_9GAMM|nr:hypothetical protein [Candidatus Berkiella aquae]MCS5711237.1 hypothetical protein [Candidatus Berkiella aquae]
MMIGMEILTWGTEQGGNPYYAPIYHYLWGGGSVGHAALKLTLPCNPENAALIQQYCCNQKGKSLIPHYRIQNNSCWVVYFSWWPGRELSEEYQDRFSANATLHINYDEKWKDFFTKTMISNSGKLRSIFGDTFYDWIFGKPAAIPQPIEEIIHPTRQDQDAQALTEMLKAKRTALQHIQKRLIPLMERSEKLLRLNFLLSCQESAEPERCAQVRGSLYLLENEMRPLMKRYKVLAREYNEFCRQYYHDVATAGCVPQRVFMSYGNELSPLKMLKAMRDIVDDGFDFHKIFNNCSTVVREIVAAGLNDDTHKRDFLPHFFDTPLKIYRSACDLQTQLIDTRLKQCIANKALVPYFRKLASDEQNPAPGFPAIPNPGPILGARL